MKEQFLLPSLRQTLSIFVSKVISIFWNLLCHLHTIGNHCANYEHHPAKIERGVLVTSCETDFKDIWLQGHIHDLKPSLSSTHHRQSLCQAWTPSVKKMKGSLCNKQNWLTNRHDTLMSLNSIVYICLLRKVVKLVGKLINKKKYLKFDLFTYLCLTNRQMDRQTDRWTDRQTDETNNMGERVQD